MNKWFVFVTLATLSSNVKAQDSLVINGTIDPIFNSKTLSIKAVLPKKVNFQYDDYYTETFIKDGRFHLSVPSKMATHYVISVKENNLSHSFLFSPEEVDISFTDTLLRNVVVSGNGLSKLAPVLRNFTNRSRFTQEEVNTNVTQWIEHHRDSPFCTYLMVNFLLENIDDDELLRLFNLIPEKRRSDPYGTEINYIINNLYIGKTAPDFVSQDTTGKKIQLSELKGKFVFIDFWASWCKPCRIENPYIVVARNLYDQAKLEIIGISLDENKELWLEAIRNDKLNYTQVSDLKGLNNETTNKYWINAIPRNFLIDTEGKIVAKNLRGKALLDILKVKIIVQN